MAKKRKCVICDQWLEDGEDSVPYKNRYAHTRCFNIAIKTLSTAKKDDLENKFAEKSKRKAKPKAELKDATSEEDYKKKQDFYKYIRSYYEDEDGDLPTRIYATVEHQMKQYGYSFEQMLQTLKYIREIKEKDIEEDGVGLIPYYYSEAMAYYKSLKLVEENNKDKDINQMYTQQIVYIKPRPRKIKQLPIETIGIGEVNG